MNKQVSSYIENFMVLLLGIFLLTFPLIFSTSFTEFFVFPKQVFLVSITLIGLILFGVKIIADKKVVVKKTPFTTILFIFAVVVSLSSFFSPNRAESLLSVFPFVFSILLYYLFINFVKNKQSFSYILYTLLLGGSFVSILSVLSFFKLYVLPASISKAQAFSTLGSLFDQAIYLIIILPIPLFLAVKNLSPLIKNGLFKSSESKNLPQIISYLVFSLILIAGFAMTFYQLFNPPAGGGQKPVVLPFQTGLQIAFASVSQDATRTFQAFLFGSGFGTFFSDFTRFKQAAFNLNIELWSLLFTRSSSFVLELLATTGFLGLISFGYLLIKVLKDFRNSLKAKKQNKFLGIPLVLVFIFSLVFPFSFTISSLFFIILAIYSVRQGLDQNDDYYDLEIHSIAFKTGFIPFAFTERREKESFRKFLPIMLTSFSLVFVAIVAYFFVKYVASDIMIQSSFAAANQNNGQKLYELQNNAIKTFPYRDSYYRLFSQTNFLLANSLSTQQKGKTPNEKTQQTIYALVQNSINSARTAVAISPTNTLNWQNLSNIYRNLIGFGQNAENFAILSAQQATLLDPNNPQQYVNLGGIYYQLGQWDNAERQFQIAINLKPDFANAYYNLGHTLENKQNLEAALAQYEAVKRLVANDKENLTKVENEIKALQEKINAPKEEEKKEVKETPKKKAQKETLEISTPSAQMPKQEPPVEIPAPKEPSPTAKEENPQPNL